MIDDDGDVEAWQNTRLLAEMSASDNDDRSSFFRKDFSISSILLASSCRLLLLVAFVVHLSYGLT